jgi:hypothetical protein
VLVLLVNISYRLRESRLSTLPGYDGGAYMADAFKRLVFADGNGLWAVLRSPLVRSSACPDQRDHSDARLRVAGPE